MAPHPGPGSQADVCTVDLDARHFDPPHEERQRRKAELDRSDARYRKTARQILEPDIVCLESDVIALVDRYARRTDRRRGLRAHDGTQRGTGLLRHHIAADAHVQKRKAGTCNHQNQTGDRQCDPQQEAQPPPAPRRGHGTTYPPVCGREVMQFPDMTPLKADLLVSFCQLLLPSGRIGPGSSGRFPSCIL